MWRMHYTILANLGRLPRILETMHRMADQPEKYTEQDCYDYVRYIVGLMQRTGHIKTDAFGTENLPDQGGYVMYPNHQGKYDAYGLVATHEKPLTVVMDQEQSYHALVDEILRILRGKRMDLQNTRQNLTVINEIAREAAQGRRYILFPEGAYDDAKRHSLWEFKPGCFKAATKAKIPIVPVALVDSYKVYNSWRITPVKTQVHFLQPLYPDDYQGLTTYQIRDIVKERIQTKLHELGLDK